MLVVRFLFGGLLYDYEDNWRMVVVGDGDSAVGGKDIRICVLVFGSLTRLDITRERERLPHVRAVSDVS